MKNTWTTIDEHIQEANSQVNQVMHSSSSPTSFWKGHKFAVGFAAIGLMLLSISVFMEPGSGTYKADVFSLPNVGNNEEAPSDENPFLAFDSDTQNEATEVEVTPLITPDKSPFSLPPDINIDNTAEEPDQNTESLLIKSPKPVDKAEEINPFLSIKTDQTFDIPEIEENILVSDIPMIEKTTNFEQDTTNNSNPFEEITHGVASPKEDADTTNDIFKENTHTYDTVSQPSFDYSNELKDPLNEEPDLYTGIHGTTNIVPVKQKVNPNLISGILRPGTPKRSTGYPFGFWLELEGGEKIKIDTQRDLRNVIGKEIKIEIAGTKDNFVLQHVYYEGNTKLAQSGPEIIFFIAGILSLAGAFIFRKRCFKKI